MNRLFRWLFRREKRRGIRVSIVLEREILEDIQQVIARRLEDKESWTEVPTQVVLEAWEMYRQLKNMDKKSIRFPLGASQLFVIHAYYSLVYMAGFTPEKHMIDKAGFTTEKYII